MKERIRTWLGVSSIQGRLTAVEKNQQIVESRTQSYVDKKVAQSVKNNTEDDKYQDCYECGSHCLKSKMTPLAVFKKDVRVDDNPFYFLFSDFLKGAKDNSSTTIFFCKNCPAKLPNKK